MDRQPPVVKTVVLKVQMHCEACAQVLQKRIRKIKGVESVTTELSSNEVRVKGFIDPDQFIRDLYKRTRKQAILVKNDQEEEKKEEGDQKKEEKKVDGEEKKQGDKEVTKEDDEVKVEVKKSEYWTPKNYMEYYATSYPPQIFSDENPNACSLM